MLRVANSVSPRAADRSARFDLARISHTVPVRTTAVPYRIAPNNVLRTNATPAATACREGPTCARHFLACILMWPPPTLRRNFPVVTSDPPPLWSEVAISLCASSYLVSRPPNLFSVVTLKLATPRYIMISASAFEMRPPGDCWVVIERETVCSPA